MFQYDRIAPRHQAEAADLLGLDPAVIVAVAEVEAGSGGSGFIPGTDLPRILFEGHIFHRQTKGRFDRAKPHLSYPKWTRAFYKGGRGEYDRLLEAIAANDGRSEPALMSTSWGMFQIMGFNHREAGYASVRDFVNAMSLGEDRQLMAFCTYLKSRKLDVPLRQQEWASFARAYNGPGYATNRYDSKLATAFARARQQAEREAELMPPERAEVMLLQAALNVEMKAGLATDGWIGPKTNAALRDWKTREGITPADDTVTPEVRARLGLDAAEM